jgi:hypothetical protein
MLGSNIGRDVVYPNPGVSWFSSVPQLNADIIDLPHTRPRKLLPTFFRIHYSLTTLQFDALECDVLTIPIEEIINKYNIQIHVYFVIFLSSLK